MQNALWQSGSDSRWFLGKKLKNVNGTRDPPSPFMANAILNFHFDYLNPSLIKYVIKIFPAYDGRKAQIQSQVREDA